MHGFVFVVYIGVYICALYITYMHIYYICTMKNLLTILDSKEDSELCSKNVDDDRNL